MTMTTLEVRDRAAQLIEAKDWSQKVGIDAQGRICMIVALQLATDDGPTLDATSSELKRELGESSLVVWQDRHGRTKEEVLALLRGARQ